MDAYPHPDDLLVDQLAAMLKAQMAADRAKGRTRWRDGGQESQEELSMELRRHTHRGDPALVALTALKLMFRCERITSRLPPMPRPLTAEHVADRMDAAYEMNEERALMERRGRAERRGARR